MRKPLIACLSGDMHSFIGAARILKQGFNVTHALFVAYGQDAEIQAEQKARAQAEFLGLQYVAVEASLDTIAGIIPWEHDEVELTTDTLFKELYIGTVAAQVATRLDMTGFMLGSHNAVGKSGVQCRAFQKAMIDTLIAQTDDLWTIFLPWAEIDSEDIINIGYDKLMLPVAELTWSCITECSEIHCGTCEGCKRRQKLLEPLDTTEYLED